MKDQSDEIERRKFLEKQVNHYTKGIIEQNSKCKEFLG